MVVANMIVWYNSFARPTPNHGFLPKIIGVICASGPCHGSSLVDMPILKPDPQKNVTSLAYLGGTSSIPNANEDALSTSQCLDGWKYTYFNNIIMQLSFHLIELTPSAHCKMLTQVND